MIDNSVLDFLMEISVLSFIFPVVILLAWRMRTKKKLAPAFMGVAVFLLFVKLLESIPYAFCVQYDNPVSRIVMANEVTYALYQGITAAVFEEMGRYIAFRYFLTKYEGRQTAITYGIGHGGMECMLLLGVGNLQNYMMAVMIQKNATAAKEVPDSVINTLSSFTAVSCVLDGISGILFLIIQIGLSIIVFQAYRNEKLRKRLMLYAMGIHFAAYLPNGLYEQGMIPQVVSLLLLLFITLFTLFMASGIYRKMGEKEKEAQLNKNKAVGEQKNWAFATKKLNHIQNEKDED